MATPVILDVDPGHDDALAILLARADPRLDLLAITTVAGNQTLDKCTLNARRICTVAGIDDVPVAAGASSPLVRELRTAADVHGESGLDGPAFGTPTVDVDDRSAVELMRDVLSAHHEPVTLVPTGPLTNIALLLRTFPQVRESISEIVLMGGTTGRGNTTPYTEFNMTVDPEAADVVFRSGLPVTMAGLNVTHQALATDEVLVRLRELGTPLARTCVELLTFYGTTYQEQWGLSAPPVHDPVAVARVADPSLVRCVEAPVLIERQGEHTAGATVVDFHYRTGHPDNARVAMDLEAEPFWDLMINAVHSYG
ncbi:purine nucleosidase/pyrimidine-specific ribonucleoside hydrolase [Haloactinopolyspora alba]|uniref:Purine nucleosidase/pyrimidine-specific ribonucleoside hydrolase n=1 Tax=Haloactinopolyspora alba TaxID=648780 RepID=A0A2P8EGA3_9ACTN|nr:nucleoside hydrolase [Haloactinopolyspora alba]PSL08503.1 purine nucleosidase/pyrimidine-specific ribonucleoside hydrolase [Haloactinopolyspora alba]